jgi:hypothetical protein
MISLLKYLLSIVPLLIVVSCKQNNTIKPKIFKNDSLVLKINFHPAFEENSETILWNLDSTHGIKILIKNNFRVDEKEDTFWFKNVSLTNQQYSELDSTLIKMCRRKVARKEYIGLDGMGISTLLTSKTDTNAIYFWSPSKKSDSVGYIFTESLFRILRNAFQDTLVNQYFNDLEEYIDESKFHKADPKREIDQLRMKKYHWTIRKMS